MKVLVTAKDFVLRSIYSCVTRRQLRCARHIIDLFEQKFNGHLGQDDLKTHLKEIRNAYIMKASVYNIKIIIYENT